MAVDTAAVMVVAVVMDIVVHTGDIRDILAITRHTSR